MWVVCVCMCVLPQVRSSIHQVKHLSRIEQLLEPAQELHTLIISTLTVHKHQQGAGARGGARRFPEPCTHTHTIYVILFIS